MIIINLIFTYVLRSSIPQIFPFTEVTQGGATGIAVAVHAEAEFGIAIAIVTIPHPKIKEETAVDLDETQRTGDATHVCAQVKSLINDLDFLRIVFIHIFQERMKPLSCKFLPLTLTVKMITVSIPPGWEVGGSTRPIFG